MKTRYFLLVLAAGFLSFTSCTKDSTPLEESSIELADDNAVSEVAFDDILNTVDNATIIFENSLPKGELKSGMIVADSCPTISVANPVTGVWPKTITVDYGDGCQGFYGSSRKGKIVITLTERRNVLNATRTITFDNYYFNGIKVEGAKVVKNAGLNTNQNMVFQISLTGGKLILPDGKTIEREFEHEREWVAGWLTKPVWDDECLITGTANGVTINGVVHTNTITTALHWKRVCRFFVSGVIEIKREGLENVVINYGTGECDALATVTTGDISREITLRNRHRLWRKVMTP